jgi:hypothetical protein
MMPYLWLLAGAAVAAALLAFVLTRPLDRASAGIVARATAQAQALAAPGNGDDE